MFLWKVLSFSLVWGPSLCLDMAHLCSLEEKSAAVLYFHGVCCQSKHHPSRLLGSCCMLPSWAGSAGNTGAVCWQPAWSLACWSLDGPRPLEVLLQEQLKGSYLHGCSLMDHCEVPDVAASPPPPTATQDLMFSWALYSSNPTETKGSHPYPLSSHIGLVSRVPPLPWPAPLPRLMIW